MTATTSKRKKYVREMKPTWWKKLDFYKLYIAREATAIPTLWFCLVLLYGVISLGSLDSFGKFHFILEKPDCDYFKYHHTRCNVIKYGDLLCNDT